MTLNGINGMTKKYEIMCLNCQIVHDNPFSSVQHFEKVNL